MNVSVRTILEISITAMLGWLILSVHNMSISVEVQNVRISSLEKQVTELRKEIKEIEDYE